MKTNRPIKEVKLLPARAAPRPAAIRDEVREGTFVRTGIESRAELPFTDQTIVRLGANTVVSFNGGVRVNTAAITGTNILLGYHRNAFIKLIVVKVVNAERIRGGGTLTNASTIGGETSNSGSLGTNEVGLVNQASGLINANAEGLFLLVDPSSAGNLTNPGTTAALTSLTKDRRLGGVQPAGFVMPVANGKGNRREPLSNRVNPSSRIANQALQ